MCTVISTMISHVKRVASFLLTAECHGRIQQQPAPSRPHRGPPRERREAGYVREDPVELRREHVQPTDLLEKGESAERNLPEECAPRSGLSLLFDLLSLL